jgi:putative DNA primase/helicase
VHITAATIFYKAHQRGWIDETRQHDLHTDLGNARRFVKRHGENVRFVPEWQKWIVWNGFRWEIDNDGAIMRLAKETVEAMYAEALGLANEQERTALLKRAIVKRSRGSRRW